MGPSKSSWGVPDPANGKNKGTGGLNGGLSSMPPPRTSNMWGGGEDEDEDDDDDEEVSGGLQRRSWEDSGQLDGGSRSPSPSSSAEGRGGGDRAKSQDSEAAGKGRSWLLKNAGNGTSLGAQVKSMVTAPAKVLGAKLGRKKSLMSRKTSSSWSENMSMPASQSLGDSASEDGNNSPMMGERSPGAGAALIKRVPGLVGFRHLQMFDECLLPVKPRKERRKDFLVTVFSTVDAGSDASTRGFLSSGERWAAVATQVVAMAGIRHPNIAAIVSIYEFNGIFALVQAPGRPLCMHYEWLLQGETYGSTPPLTSSQILSWAMDLSQAVAALHQNDPVVLHRKICPRSIILEPDTMDLRLGHIGSCAMMFQGSEQRVKGSDEIYKLEAVPDADPRYTAPEAIELVRSTVFNTGSFSDEAEYGPSADVFSMGATMYYLATGLDPLDEYEDDDIAHMMGHMGQRPDPKEQGVERIDDERKLFSRLISQTMHADPSKRPLASDVCDELKHIMGTTNLSSDTTSHPPLKAKRVDSTGGKSAQPDRGQFASMPSTKNLAGHASRNFVSGEIDGAGPAPLQRNGTFIRRGSIERGDRRSSLESGPSSIGAAHGGARQQDSKLSQSPSLGLLPRRTERRQSLSVMESSLPAVDPFVPRDRDAVRRKMNGPPGADSSKSPAAGAVGGSNAWGIPEGQRDGHRRQSKSGEVAGSWGKPDKASWGTPENFERGKFLEGNSTDDIDALFSGGDENSTGMLERRGKGRKGGLYTNTSAATAALGTSKKLSPVNASMNRRDSQNYPTTSLSQIEFATSGGLDASVVMRKSTSIEGLSSMPLHVDTSSGSLDNLSSPYATFADVQRNKLGRKGPRRKNSSSLSPGIENGPYSPMTSFDGLSGTPASKKLAPIVFSGTPGSSPQPIPHHLRPGSKSSAAGAGTPPHGSPSPYESSFTPDARNSRRPSLEPIAPSGGGMWGSKAVGGDSQPGSGKSLRQYGTSGSLDSLGSGSFGVDEGGAGQGRRGNVEARDKRGRRSSLHARGNNSMML